VKLARALLLAVLEDLVASRGRDGGTWLRQNTRNHADIAVFAAAFAGTSRSVGRGALGLTPAEVNELRAVGLTWPLDRWALDDLARAALLLRVGEVLEQPGIEAVVERRYRDGDAREKQAILRALPLLPRPERFLAFGVDAARSGIPPLFEAIACENPYPAAHFPPLNFNHLVMQALVTGAALERVLGLGARVTPDLVRMANDWASERRAAGRSVPADIDYITEAARVVAA